MTGQPYELKPNPGESILNSKRLPEPVDANGFHDRGNRYSRNGSYELAIADYNKAIEMDPGFSEAHYDRGFSFYEMGSYEEAIADLTRAIELSPDDARYYGQRSLAYLFADQMDLAQADEEMSDALRNRGLDEGPD